MHCALEWSEQSTFCVSTVTELHRLWRDFMSSLAHYNEPVQGERQAAECANHNVDKSMPLSIELFVASKQKQTACLL